MTQEQFDIIIAKLNAIAKALAPTVMDNLLVGGGDPKPIAPTVLEIAANPAKFDGTQWDPIKRDFRMSNTVVITRFESMDKAGDFVGGTLQDWARVDFAGCWRFLQDQYPSLDVNRLSASQRAFLGL